MKKTIRNVVLVVIVMMSIGHNGYSQEWFTSLDAAKRLAMVQDKLIFMMWEESTLGAFPVIIEDESGKSAVVDDLFEAQFLNRIIWEHFIPVSVSESMYPKLYEEIKGKRSYNYINKFNDDSVKIMDVNGNILNIEPDYDDLLNITKLIRTYYLNTSLMKQDLSNYRKEQNLTTAFRLGVKYIDMAMYCNAKARPEVIALSNLYLEEVQTYLNSDTYDDEQALIQKLELMNLLQQLVLNKPRRVLRKLDKIDASEIHNTNESLVAFLYLTAHRVLKDEKSASVWRSKVSLVNLKKAEQIIKISNNN